MKIKQYLAAVLAASVALTFSATGALAEADINDIDAVNEQLNESVAVAFSTAEDSTPASDSTDDNASNGDPDETTAAAELSEEAAAVSYTLSDAGYQNRIIGTYGTSHSMEAIILRAGDLLADGSPASVNTNYSWYSVSAPLSDISNNAVGDSLLLGYPSGSVSDGNGEMIPVYNDQGLSDAKTERTTQYRVDVTAEAADGTQIKLSKKYKLEFTKSLTSFCLSAKQENAEGAPSVSNELVSSLLMTPDFVATPESPVTLVADVDPLNTEAIRKMLQNDGKNVVVEPGHVRWSVIENYRQPSAHAAYSEGPYEETTVEGKPALKLWGGEPGHRLPNGEYGDSCIFYCVVDYVYHNGNETGLIQYHSQPVAVHLPGVDDVKRLPDIKRWYEWGLVDQPADPGNTSSGDVTPGDDTPGSENNPNQNPGGDNTSSEPTIKTCPYFQKGPLTEEECVALYNQLVAPYRNTRVRNQPFALKDPVMNEDGTQLSMESQEQLASLISFIRACAGVSGISVDTAKSEYAQAAAQYNSTHGTLGHYGAADDMSAEGRKANYGLTHSNMSYGSLGGGQKYDLTQMLLNQFRDDNGSNWPSIGHRRWLLDNRTTSMGFGYATGRQNGEHLAVYIKDDILNNGFGGGSFEAFPGYGAFPVELMDCKAWTLTLGNGWRVPSSGVSMKVVRDEGTSTELSVDLERIAPNAAWSASGDFFTVNTTEIGTGPVLVFSPGSMYPRGDVWNTKGLAGHTYTIYVNGLQTRTGLPAEPIAYTTQFFSLNNPNYTGSVDGTGSSSADPSPEVSLTPNEPSGPDVPDATETPHPIESAPQVSDEPELTPAPQITPVPQWPSYNPGTAPQATVRPVGGGSSVTAPFVPASTASAPAASSAPAQTPAPTEKPAATPKPTTAPAPSLSAASGENASAAIVAVSGSQIVVAVPQTGSSVTRVSDILAGITASGGKVKVKTATGADADLSAPAATGMMVCAYDANGMLSKVYPLIVPFDVLGTGTMNLSQVVRLTRGFTGVEPLHGIYLDAGSQNSPGKITLTDLVQCAKLYMQSEKS